MPSHKIHLAIAYKVNQKLKKNLDDILLGSVLPDLTVDKNHKQSHFQSEVKGIYGLANPYEIIQKYKQ